MKIAIPYENGQVFQHFGHSAQFKLYTAEEGRITGAEVVSTDGQGHGALVGFLVRNGVNVLLCGGIGGGAQMALAQAGIRLCGGITGDADSAAAAYLAATLVFELCPQLVVGIFGQGDPLYWEFAIQTFRIFLSLITFTCFIKMTSIFFQAVGEPGKATAASLIRDLACFVPLALLLPHKFGIQGVLYAGPAADAIAMVVAVVLTVRFFQQMNRQAKKA